jgi:hypothetical protein
MKLYKNNAQDLVLKFGANTYRRIEEIFNSTDHEFVNLHFMLALLGYQANSKISLESKDKNSDQTRSFTLRTAYPKNSTEMDTQYGLLAILDNINESYETVVNQLAFEKTEIRNVSFFKMINVKTFYEFMLGGIDFVEKEFLQYGMDVSDIADAIHDFLEEDSDQTQKNVEEILSEALIDES